MARWIVVGWCLSVAAVAQEPEWAAPPIEEQVAVRDGRSGERVSIAAMIERLASADVVFAGETHLDETTHRVERMLYEALLEHHSGKVVLSLEMFERNSQRVLDDYVNGKIDEATFVERTRPWGNYRTAYRRLIERARAQRRPVVAANFPRPLARMAGNGDQPFAQLPERLRPLVPKQLLANSPDYWRRVDNAVRGHLGMMGGPRAPDDPRLTSMQSLWDNSMGEACALALDRHPDHVVLHVCGGFHSAYWDGTVKQFAMRKPNAKAMTIDITPVDNPMAGRPRGRARADFVVYAESRANDIDEGTYTIVADREVRYRLHVPQQARDTARVPLLIWLGSDGLTSQDGIDLWRSRLGDEVAIVAPDLLYRERGADLGESGRWFWADTFRQDIGVIVQAVERTWGYVLRNQPVDPTRVVIAGEGTGATAAAAVALLSMRFSGSALALGPRHYAKLKDFPLPLPELRADDPRPPRTLAVLGTDGDKSWWDKEVAEYRAIGTPSSFTVRHYDPWQSEPGTEQELRRALGLPTEELPDGPRRHVRITADTPRARHWARLVALAKGAKGEQVAILEPDGFLGDSKEIDTAVRAADFADGTRSLPLCPGPFGGTTVVVVPDAASDEERAAWLAIEANDPLNAKSRFHRVRIATESGEGSLPFVLAKLQTQNRTNVLIVPASFCVDGNLMRRLHRGVRNMEPMTLHWRPGLGAN